MRRQSRELALQILFQIEFAPQIEYSNFLELFEENVDQETLNYADLLISGVKNHKTEIDNLIQTSSQHWKIGRMALVDRNLLRIAIFEMKFLNSPLKVNIAINEAVDLAKKYGSTDSGSFVNGILDQISKGS